MKALVTGGAGFIGSNLVKLLLNKGISVRVLDNLSSGYLSNLDNLPIDFVHGDILDKNTCNLACQNQDVVFHLAASVGRQRSIDYPQLDSSINLIGTINLLEAMRSAGTKRIVYSSSAAIFGELKTDSIDEFHPQNADSPYGVSKLAGEKMILAYSDIHGIEAVCLRYFNIYGVNQRYDLYGNVIPIFTKRLLAGQPITIFGDGEQTRDFVNVEDIAEINFLASVSGHKKAVYNVGCGESITINHLAQLMGELTEQETSIQYAPARAADTLHCRANINKAVTELGYRPKIDLKDGLVEYLEWFKQQ